MIQHHLRRGLGDFTTIIIGVDPPFYHVLDQSLSNQIEHRIQILLLCRVVLVLHAGSGKIDQGFTVFKIAQFGHEIPFVLTANG